MILSPFTPLFFSSNHRSDGLPTRHINMWASTDRIMIQVFADVSEDAPAATLNDAHTGEVLGTIEWQSWQMNENKVLYFFFFQGLSVGHYTVTIAGQTSDEFRVTNDPYVLANTTLIQYRFRDNRQRDDMVSIISGMEYFFDWRVPGGFKDSGWSFGVTNEQFTTQFEDVVELYATDYVLKTFTMGGPEGVPVWFGEMLNRVLTCSYVYFDGERYTRNDGETPSLNALVDGMDSFVFSQVLRKAHILDPVIEEINQAALRRVLGADSGVDYDKWRTTANNSDVSSNNVLIL